MRWFDSILDLQFYTPPPGSIPCYCEQVVYPWDMVLQGFFAPSFGTYGFDATVFTPDGLTVIEDVTANFERYYFINPVTGEYGFNARLLYFADSMCTNPCYIIRIRVYNGDGAIIFNKFTERYCQTSCCDLASGISIVQDGLVAPVTPLTPITNNNPKITDCNERIYTLITESDCYDKFSGNFYGIPTQILQGDATFSYFIITNFRGRVVIRPREITREYSFNCSLQKVESKRIYLLESYEYYPPWKMDEIEAQLHASNIYIDTIRYEYAGGTPFELLNIPNCYELFKLNTTLEDCTQRAIYGCGVPCGTNNNYDGNMVMYVVPSSYDGGNVYNESGVLVATTWDEFLDYVRNLDGMYALSDVTPVSGFGCDVYGAFSVSGTGYIPGSFYFGSFQQSNRVFSNVLGSVDEICGQVGTECASPVVGTITVEVFICDSPVVGTITVDDVTPETVGIEGTPIWNLDGSEDILLYSNNTVDMHFIVGNMSLPEDPDNPGVPVYVFYQQIATVGASGRPATQLILNEFNSSLPTGVTLVINTDGSIYYEGLATASAPTQSTIEIDIIYTI